jgi:putative transposase
LEIALSWIEKGYPTKTVLKICDVPRSTYYWRLKHPKRRIATGGGRPIPGYSRDRDGHRVPDVRIKACIRQLLQGPHHASGYRKLTKLLRRKYRLVTLKHSTASWNGNA